MKVFITFLAFCALVYGNGYKLDGRIIGGKEVDIRTYPYQVSVRVFDHHICGGSILNANIILTAAHCVHEMDHSQYSVRVGNIRHTFGSSYRVAQVIKNINYHPITFDNDMAILKLVTPLSFSKYVQPVDLQPQGVDVKPGTAAWVSGWGFTQEGTQNNQPFLRAVDVSVISNFECINKYNIGITRRMMCAQTLGHDSCQGDSGGPLVANGRLIGVVSWGYGCARPEYPGVYAKVSNMYSWIIANSH